MFHSATFIASSVYRDINFSTCPEDRPLVVQFCANNEDTFLKAALMVVGRTDAVDLNLGCPQHIARRGYYGSFLQENPALIYRLINKLATHLPIPITAKIRILETEEQTLQYARMVQDAGAQLITIHGRTRRQKGQFAGNANWEIIHKIKETLCIPVIANGSVDRYVDIERCQSTSHADGVMAAQGLLRNPALFSGLRLPEVQLAAEYLDLVEQYPVRISSVRAHLFKMLQSTLVTFPDLATRLADRRTIADFCEVLEWVGQAGAPLHYNDEVFDESWTSPLRHAPLQTPAYDNDVVDGMGGMFACDNE